jgi:hypothetical protein
MANEIGSRQRDSHHLGKPLKLVVPVMWLVVGLIGAYPSSLYGQAVPVADRRLIVGAFGTTHFANTQMPYFADNAFGFEAGAFLQLTPLLGVEARGGAAPIGATFEQEPVTVGARVAQPQRKETQALGFAYFGGGFSRAQYSKANYRPSVPLLTPCWQASVGTDIAFRKVTWRIYEATWTETYAIRQNLRSMGISSGLVYTFKR